MRGTTFVDITMAYPTPGSTKNVDSVVETTHLWISSQQKSFSRRTAFFLSMDANTKLGSSSNFYADVHHGLANFQPSVGDSEPDLACCTGVLLPQTKNFWIVLAIGDYLRAARAPLWFDHRPVCIE